MSIPLRPPKWFFVALALVTALLVVSVGQWIYLAAQTLRPPIEVRQTPGLEKRPLVHCHGLTRLKKPCRNVTRDPSGFCYLHRQSVERH